MTVKLQHLALIPDGDRRWAKAHNLPVLAGHQQVLEKVFPDLVKKALLLEIPFFTIWGFSTENWSRNQTEVEGLFKLFDLFFNQYGDSLHQQGVKIVHLGRTDNLAPRFTKVIDKWSAITRNNQKLQLNIAFNYGGRDEIIRAVNQFLVQKKDDSQITEENLAQFLDTGKNNIPDPDLIIRTSGEKRLSGLFSWQSAYSELYFSDKPMPDWSGEDLELAVQDYYHRQRRYGK